MSLLKTMNKEFAGGADAANKEIAAAVGPPVSKSNTRRRGVAKFVQMAKNGRPIKDVTPDEVLDMVSFIIRQENRIERMTTQARLARRRK